MRPQTATGTGFARLARTEVETADAAAQSRSSSIGNATMLITSATRAKHESEGIAPEQEGERVGMVEDPLAKANTPGDG